MKEAYIYELFDLDFCQRDYQFDFEDGSTIVADDSECEYLAAKKNYEIDSDGIPIGNSKEEMKLRERIIKDFYARWIEQNPSKEVWNDNLSAFIHVKFASINETFAKAARSYESTCAVFHLTEILQSAVKQSESCPKQNKNQRVYEKMILMRAMENVKLMVGLQKSNQEYVQYSITVPTQKNAHPEDEH